MREKLALVPQVCFIVKFSPIQLSPGNGTSKLALVVSNKGFSKYEIFFTEFNILWTAPENLKFTNCTLWGFYLAKFSFIFGSVAFPGFLLCALFFLLTDIVLFAVKPFFHKEPSDATILAGESVQFQCKVGGDPTPNILWRRDDGKMPIGRAHILDDKSLRIENVTPEDEGLYICDAENLVGTISARASLTVHCKYLVFNSKLQLWGRKRVIQAQGTAALVAYPVRLHTCLTG